MKLKKNIYLTSLVLILSMIFVYYFINLKIEREQITYLEDMSEINAQLVSNTDFKTSSENYQLDVIINYLNNNEIEVTTVLNNITGELNNTLLFAIIEPENLVVDKFNTLNLYMTNYLELKDELNFNKKSIMYSFNQDPNSIYKGIVASRGLYLYDGQDITSAVNSITEIRAMVAWEDNKGNTFTDYISIPKQEFEVYDLRES